VARPLVLLLNCGLSYVCMSSEELFAGRRRIRLLAGWVEEDEEEEEEEEERVDACLLVVFLEENNGSRVVVARSVIVRFVCL